MFTVSSTNAYRCTVQSSGISVYLWYINENLIVNPRQVHVGSWVLIYHSWMRVYAYRFFTFRRYRIPSPFPIYVCIMTYKVLVVSHKYLLIVSLQILCMLHLVFAWYLVHHYQSILYMKCT